MARLFAELLAGPYAGAFAQVTFAVRDRSEDKSILRAFERQLN